jgi:hypothetical protein
LVRNSGNKNRAETRKQAWSDNFCLFPLCPFCECLPLADISSTPVPNATLQHCYMTFIGLAQTVLVYILRIYMYIYICTVYI